jgi:hypothetical protein
MPRVDFAQRLLIHERVLVDLIVLDVVGGKMLGAGNDMLLQACSQCRSHAPHMIHVLAVGLLRPPPVGMPNDVHAGSEQHRVFRGHGFFADGITNLFTTSVIVARKRSDCSRGASSA